NFVYADFAILDKFLSSNGQRGYDSSNIDTNLIQFNATLWHFLRFNETIKIYNHLIWPYL
ncbi:MAG: hypothetical protein K2G98_09180, partial [Duncaniella sp.]|nr:hypothetical protein [Duncaniella sp.]